MLLSYDDLMLSFKIMAVRGPVILRSRFLNCEYSSENHCASLCKVLWWSVKPLLRYGDFSICQNGGRPPCWIL